MICQAKSRSLLTTAKGRSLQESYPRADRKLARDFSDREIFDKHTSPWQHGAGTSTIDLWVTTQLEAECQIETPWAGR